MKSLLPLLLSLALLSGTWVRPMIAASPPLTPVVATWFSNLHPRVGQRETVHVQFWAGKRYLSGARLSVTLRVGTKTVAHLRGTTTDKKGEAWARFTVPKAAAGKWLWAFTGVIYQKRTYTGNNRVLVAR